MKTIEKESLAQLLDIIPDKPAQRLLHLCTDGDTLSDMLSTYIKQENYEYQLLCAEANAFDEMQNKYKELSHVSVMKFPLKRPRYVIQGRDYEFVFVTMSIEASERSGFLKKIYELIKHAGNILIFIPKNDYEQEDHWLSLLEEHLYVATSKIDNMFEHYDVLISRRMHGWGSK